MEISTTLRNMRKKVAGFSVMMIIAGMFSTGVASAQTTTTGNIFSDVPADAYYAACVNDLADQGVIMGKTIGSEKMYEPRRHMQRDEVTKVALLAAGIEVQTATVSPFTDVPMTAWAVSYIHTAESLGIVDGYKKADGTATGMFGPSDKITRSQFAKVVVNAFALEAMTDGGPHFPDVQSSAWYYTFVETAFNNGIIKGNPDGTFKPEENINRADAATMLCRAQTPVVVGFKLDSAAAAGKTKVELIFSMPVDPTTAAVAANYMIADSSGNKLNVTAAEVIADDTVHLTTASQEQGKTYTVTTSNIESTSGDMVTNGMEGVTFSAFGTPTNGGPMTVSLSSTTPVTGSVPNGATGVVFTCWDFAAGSQEAMVNSVHVHRVGPGSQAAFQNVYLYRGDMRLTTGRSINSESQMVEFNNINQAVRPGETAKLCLVADLTTVSGGVHAFELVSKDDVMTNSSDLQGSFPLRGADQLITTGTVGTATVRKNGSLPELTIGQVDARIAQFEIEANGSEDMDLRRIALYVRGSINTSDLSNLRLMAEGETATLATTSTVGDKSLATFSLTTPFKIGRGQRKILYVVADVKGRNADTIKTYLDENTDLLITGRTYGYGAKVVSNTVGTGYDGGDTDSTEGNGVGDQYSFVRLKGGLFNLNWTGPTSGDVAIGQNNVRCLDLTLNNSSSEDVQIKDWVVTLAVTNAHAGLDTNDLVNGTDLNYTNIKLARINDDGSVSGALLGPSELSATGSDDSQDLTLSGDATIAANSTVKASVTMNIANNTALSGDKIRCTLANIATSDRVRDANGDQLQSNSVTPAAPIQGSTLNVTVGGLTASVASTPAKTTYAFGTTNAPLVGFSFTAGQSLDITITDVTVQGYGAVNAATPFVAGKIGANDLKNSINVVELVDSATNTVLDTANLESDGTAVFNIPQALRVKITKGGTKNLIARAQNIANTANAGVVKFALKLSGPNPIITAIDQNGQTVPAASIIDTSAAQNSLTAGSGTYMTLNPTGTGTITGNNPVSLVSSLQTGSSSDPKPQVEIARWTFTSQNQQSMLQDFELRTLGKAQAIDRVYLYTGSSCSTPVATNADGKSVTSLPATETAGVLNQGRVQFTNVGINVPTGGVTICAKASLNEVPSNGADEPTSGTGVGLVLFNVTEVTGGSFNVSDKFIGTALGAGETLATAMTTVSTTLDESGATGFAIGDVAVVGDEMMLVVTAGVDPTVIRGFAGTLASSHAIGEDVRKVSTIAKRVTAAADVKINDVFVRHTATDYTYCLATSAAGVTSAVLAYTVAGPACIAPVAGDTVFQLHGPLSTLRRTVPTFANLNPSTTQSFGVAEIVVNKFSITASGPEGANLILGGANSVSFETTGNVVTLDSCSVVEPGTNTVLDDGANTQVTVGGPAETFVFKDAPVLTIPSSSTINMELRCTPVSAGASSTFQVKLTNATYNDGTGDHTDKTLYNTKFPIVGQTFKNAA